MFIFRIFFAVIQQSRLLRSSNIIPDATSNSLPIAYCLLPTVLAVLFICVLSMAQQAVEASGQAELKRGDYERAIQAFNKQLSANTSDHTAQHGLMRAYLEIGRYAEAESSAKKFLAKHPDAGKVRHTLAEVYTVTGRYAEAINEFERASKLLTAAGGSPSARLESELRRAEVLALTGQEEQANEIFQSLVRYYNTNNPQTAPELTVIARALVHLDKHKDANDLYLAAIAADGTYIEAHLGGGELFTEKYNYAEAADFFRDALKINPNNARAYVGIAANKRLGGGEEMNQALARALEINPNSIEARTLRAESELEAEHYDKAATEIEQVLKINPNSLEAHSLRAALLYLQDRDYETEVRQTLLINPRYGLLYETLSHFATITRRYAQAAQFSRRAIELSPRLWRAHLSLGVALLRIGRIEEGRTAIETAFKGDPFNLWAKNTLDLLDAMRDYKETKRGAFIVKAEAKEHDVLAAYAAELLEDAATKLTAKYRFTPQAPILVELFPNHEDFAVRALGLPGLGALGVCFGQVIALDSPSARPIGQFNWGSTLWHEYTHVLTLQMTEHRIPRWFSEGLSVYEERQGRPGWGDDWNEMVLKALADKRWFKIADLDAGFQRPRRASDVPLAYFQASQICEFIIERYGFDAILQMLGRYRDKARTPEVLKQVLKLSEAEFDRAFDEYIQGKARPFLNSLALGTGNLGLAQLTKDSVLRMLEAREDFALHLRAGALYQKEENVEKAVQHYKRAIELFPYYTGEGNAYEQLAQIFMKLGDTSAAAEVLELLIKQDENNFNAMRQLAKLRLDQGDKVRALETLKLSFFVNPFDYTTHTQAGELYLARNEAVQAVKEFQAALALQPPNAAEANYNIARAHFAAGKAAEAKRAVIRSLEAAPGFEKAQELLLKVTGQ